MGEYAEMEVESGWNRDEEEPDYKNIDEHCFICGEKKYFDSDLGLIICPCCGT